MMWNVLHINVEYNSQLVWMQLNNIHIQTIKNALILFYMRGIPIFVLLIFISMSEKEMNSYRLTSMEEPTEQMLSTLMKEVAEEARRKGEEATNKFFKGLDEIVAIRKQEWIERSKKVRSDAAANS